MNTISVALIGNPNSGKTTIFNQLTGSHQHVGNYPGVTVERKEGRAKYNDCSMQIIDLPGTYSLSAYSVEELIARDYIIQEKPDVVVDIIDASNLERNLYLAIQLFEFGIPVVLALNMSDMARARGHEFDLDVFASTFGARVVQTVGHKGEGLDNLLEAIAASAAEKNRIPQNRNSDQPLIDYGKRVEEEIQILTSMLSRNGSKPNGYSPRWLAVKLLEQDEDVRAKMTSHEVLHRADLSTLLIQQRLREQPEAVIAAKRYEFIAEISRKAVRSTIDIKDSLSDRIDAVVTHRVLGIPVFLGLMYLVFQMTFSLADPVMGWIEEGFAWSGETVTSWWPAGSESVLKSLLVDGIIGGVGGVLVFLPNILLLFLAISILEDSGYMARAAFIMDRLMQKVGLHGKSFIPMLIGFGCSVPAIMATRTLDNQRDRLTTMLVIPLMSCGARLPIYALIIPAFFPETLHAPMLWSIYIVGILLAIITARLLRSTVLQGESVPFVMELPPYRLPTPRSVLTHMWERGWLYLKKAGTVILGISIILWAFTTFPGMPEDQVQRFERERQEIQAASITEQSRIERRAAVNNEESETALAYTIAGRIGHMIEPLIEPMGFDWKIGTALIGAFAAKEVFVAQLGIVHAVGEGSEESVSLRDKLQQNYTPLVGFCIMLFCLISAPCMATIAVTKRESNSWKWALLQLGGLTVLAYIITVATYQFGSIVSI